MSEDEPGDSPPRRPARRRGHRVEVGELPWRSAAELDGMPGVGEAAPEEAPSEPPPTLHTIGPEDDGSASDTPSEPPASVGPPPLPDDARLEPVEAPAEPPPAPGSEPPPPPSGEPEVRPEAAPRSEPPPPPPSEPPPPPSAPADAGPLASEPPPETAPEDELELEEVASAAEEPAAETGPGQPPPPPTVGLEPRLTPPPPRRARARPWFEDFFDDEYMRTVPTPRAEHIARECDFIERSLGLSPGAAILDVGCGLGLHAVELTRRGYSVVGFDLSIQMLARAGEEAQERGLRINFLQGDMREMVFEGRFDAVLCWGTSFGYFDDEANRQVVSRLYAALKPMGLLLLDVVNRDFVLAQQPNLVWFEGDGCVCMEETQFNYITSRLEVKRTVILDDGRQRETNYALRLYSLHELGQLLHQHGFRVAQVSGNDATPGVFFGADSRRMLILAERRLRGGTGLVPVVDPDVEEEAPEPPAPDDAAG